MSPEDQQKLSTAFRDAVAKNPRADKPVEGIKGPDGKSLTLRQLIDAAVADEATFKEMDRLIAKCGITVDDIIRINVPMLEGRKP